MLWKLYSLDYLSGKSSDYAKMWQKIVPNFEKSFKEGLSLFGVDPREEYLALTEKYEVLKKKITAQEETIEHLRALLKDKVMDPGEMIHGFQDLMEKQSNQFQQSMDSIAHSIQESGC